MPAPGEQHSAIINPFEEAKPRVSEYTAQEIATLQSRLEKQLGPEYLSSRAGPSGQKVHYIAAEKCIALANDVFGFNGWSSAIKEIQVDFVDENPQTLKISLGLSVIVRVSLRDGTFHEDIGYGHIDNCKGKAAAFEKAKKEGTTDALKRALRNFGNVLGNCIYDKAYLQKVTKMKVEPSKFDEGGLHRHADFTKKEAKVVEVKPDLGNTTDLSAIDSFEDLLGEFDEVDFNVMEEGHPDEVILSTNDKSQAPRNNNINNNNINSPNSAAQYHMQPPSRPLARSHSAGHPVRNPQTLNQPPSRPGGPQNMANQGNCPPPPQQNQTRPQNFQNGGNAGQGQGSGSGSGSGPSGLPHQTPPRAPQNQGQIAPANGAASETVGFFSARAVSQLVGAKGDEEAKLPTAPKVGQVFNPHAESPSIPKTPGIDHTKSKPLSRSGKHVPPAERNEEAEISAVPRVNGAPGAPASVNSMGARGPAQQPQARGNTMNPQLHQARRIGAPGGAGSPLANRNQYRPPTMKRPLDANGGTPGRPALAEVTSNGAVNTTPGGAVVGGDVKRQKMG